MPNTTGLAVKVGIFVIGALMLMIAFSLRVSGGFGTRNQTELDAYFETTAGLTQGAAVALNGVRVGSVTELDFDPGRRMVRARISIEDRYQLPVDSEARIDRSAFLGNSTIMIRYGTSSTMLARGDEIPTAHSPGIDEVVAMIAEFGEEAREFLGGFQDGQDGLFATIQEVIEENRADIREASRSLAETGPRLEALAEELQLITADVREGRGTVGKLFTDDELYNDLKAFSEEAQRIASDLREGNGTLSRLIYDDSLARSAEESFEKIGLAGEEVQKLLAGREGDIDELFSSLREVGPRLEEAMARIAEITRKLEEGEGTLGLMLTDPGLYQDTRRAVNQVSESFENSEEQGVVRSFLGILFGAFI